LTRTGKRDRLHGMTTRDREPPLSPPDDGLDDNERYERELRRDLANDAKMDEMRDRELREEGR